MIMSSSNKLLLHLSVISHNRTIPPDVLGIRIDHLNKKSDSY